MVCAQSRSLRQKHRGTAEIGTWIFLPLSVIEQPPCARFPSSCDVCSVKNLFHVFRDLGTKGLAAFWDNVYLPLHWKILKVALVMVRAGVSSQGNTEQHLAPSGQPTRLLRADLLSDSFPDLGGCYPCYFPSGMVWRSRTLRAAGGVGWLSWLSSKPLIPAWWT